MGALALDPCVVGRGESKWGPTRSRRGPPHADECPCSSQIAGRLADEYAAGYDLRRCGDWLVTLQPGRCGPQSPGIGCHCRPDAPVVCQRLELRPREDAPARAKAAPLGTDKHPKRSIRRLGEARRLVHVETQGNREASSDSTGAGRLRDTRDALQFALPILGMLVWRVLCHRARVAPSAVCFDIPVGRWA